MWSRVRLGLGRASCWRRCERARGFGVLGARGSEFEAEIAFGVARQLFEPWTCLGRSYRCQVRLRVSPKPGLPHMIATAWRGAGGLVSARSARRELKTSRAM